MGLSLTFKTTHILLYCYYIFWLQQLLSFRCLTSLEKKHILDTIALPLSFSLCQR